MEFHEGTYLITGITGFLGSMTANELMHSEEYKQGRIKITGITRDIFRARQIFNSTEHQELLLVEVDIRDRNDLLSAIDSSVDYIIHCASVTRSAEMVRHPVETADSIVMGTRNMLELAKKLQIESMVCLSSMEVYGTVGDIGRPRKEDELGEVELFSPRSCYPLGKRMAEHYCYIYQQEYGVPVKISRLAQTFGKGIRPDDNRVYMQFARAVNEGRDIVLKTMGNSMGNYCASDDAVNAVFTILYCGRDGEAYNVVNEENTMSIREMAELAAGQTAGEQIKVKIELEDPNMTGYAPDTGLKLSGEKLRQLGWHPSKNLAEMYRDVIRTL
ncbi:hypothetical protein C808_00818 [Lachnospiraceae bacterium M18-1]|nr:hypothetical protein C808_00818 [Lachnospiraceae bacterium M18-1]